jgi:hypothetical protein
MVEGEQPKSLLLRGDLEVCFLVEGEGLIEAWLTVEEKVDG